MRLGRFALLVLLAVLAGARARAESPKSWLSKSGGAKPAATRQAPAITTSGAAVARARARLKVRFAKQPELRRAIAFTSGDVVVAIDRQWRAQGRASVHVDPNTGALVLDGPAPVGRTLRLP